MFRKPAGSKQSSDRFWWKCGTRACNSQAAAPTRTLVTGGEKKKNYDNMGKKSRESEGLLGCQPCEAAPGV